MFALPPDEAREVTEAHGVTYLATCGEYALVGASPAERKASLWSRIAAGDLPNWLEKLPAASGDVFTVYRVKPLGS